MPKYQLLVDRAEHQKSKTSETNPRTTWIDYTKAYDSMSHTSILLCLALYNNALTQSQPNKSPSSVKYMKKYMKVMHCPHCCSTQVSNPYQPLLINFRYRFRSGVTIHHFMYTVCIKVYPRREQDFGSLIHLTSIYSEDISFGMSCGLNKCS